MPYEDTPSPTDVRIKMSRGTLLAVLLLVVAAGGLAIAVSNASGDSSSDANELAAAAAGPEQTDETTATTADAVEAETELADAPLNLGPAGTLDDVEAWLQTDATSFEDFDGQVLIVQFWTYSCHNCTATIPFLQDIYAEYEPQGLEIIGVHAPEFDFERDVAGVQAASEELGVTWPVAIDNQKTNFRSWQPDRRFWPRTFVVDQNGDIRFDRIGEGKYQELEDTVAWLIENGP